MSISLGDLIRASTDERSGIIPYNFRVLYVKPENTFVLDKWGTFLLKKVNARQTRLIIRTQIAKTTSLKLKAINYLVIPLHFIMERRTLMGIKARAEAGENIQLSQSKDILWFFGIVLSGLLIWVLVFIGRGTIQSIIIPTVLGLFWLLSFLLFNPIPLYSIGLLLVVSITILSVIKTRSTR